ncbi:MAG: dihydropteroate synthase [Candidatus Omnitrophota bacterium]|nr:dihydropteroate synthase [Candidatus Omnitrophota bacterium]
MRVLQAKINRKQDIRELMRRIRVDAYGVKIMLPKALACLVQLDSITNIKANILKQEMLSLGGDAAIARTALSGGVKTTDCLLMGNLAQFGRLSEKLKVQPFGLDGMGRELSLALANYQKESFRLDLGRYKINLTAGKAAIMGILNLTPDSFSGDGLYSSFVVRRPSSVDADKTVNSIVDYALQLVDDGADIIDIGGESSRPGAKAVSIREELKRVIPALKRIARSVKAPISIDTYKPAVAEAALSAGAVMVNDITGLRDLKLARAVAAHKAAVVIMHMRGNPRTMQVNPRYSSVVDEVIDYLSLAIKRALDAGIDREKIVIDPGLGFGKTLRHNLEILKRLDEFKVLGRPIMIGASRKSFIGKILDADVSGRLCGTVSASVAGVSRGAKLVRVHDVSAAHQALRVLSAINSA